MRCIWRKCDSAQRRVRSDRPGLVALKVPQTHNPRLRGRRQIHGVLRKCKVKHGAAGIELTWLSLSRRILPDSHIATLATGGQHSTLTEYEIVGGGLRASQQR